MPLFAMTRFILRRLISLLISLFAVSVIVFVLMKLAPGGPFSFEKQLPDYVMENIRHKYGLDQPVFQQYLSWVSAMLHGDFGVPYQSPTETVVQLVLRAWPVTLL